MAFDVARVDRLTQEAVSVPVSMFSSFKDEWLPLCDQLGLRSVPRLGNAGWLDEEGRLNLIAELVQLRNYLEEQDDEQARIVARIGPILELITAGTCDQFEYVLG